MSADAITRIEQTRGRKFTVAEAARLREIGSSLSLRDDDAVWSILAALEYQRTCYEALPEKIAGASKDVLQGITLAAEKETAAAQAKLTKSVVEQAQKLSVELNYATLLPMGIAALVCVLAFGSLTMWAGYCLGSKRIQDMALMLRMPSGFLMAGLCLAGGLFLGVCAARQNIEEEKGWWKIGVAALMMFSVGVVVALFAVQ